MLRADLDNLLLRISVQEKNPMPSKLWGFDGETARKRHKNEQKELRSQKTFDFK